MGKLTGVLCPHDFFIFYRALTPRNCNSGSTLNPTWEGAMNIHTHLTTCIIGRDKEVAVHIKFFNLCEMCDDWLD